MKKIIVFEILLFFSMVYNIEKIKDYENKIKFIVNIKNFYKNG